MYGEISFTIIGDGLHLVSKVSGPYQQGKGTIVSKSNSVTPLLCRRVGGGPRPGLRPRAGHRDSAVAAGGRCVDIYSIYNYLGGSCVDI